jgi:glycosyltransferase involved in cell wall biosynthesis
MKILLSAYACAPNFGSEPSIGWNFAEQLALQGHQVIVFTNDESRPYIEKYNKLENLTFIYYRLPLWIKRIIYRDLGPLAHIYNFFWQIGSYLYLKKFLTKVNVDLVHLITLGVFRTPVFLGLLPPPFILGPVGGGEVSTPQLQRELPLKFRLKEAIRHCANLSVLVNPLMYITYATTDLILLKTSDNLKFIPKRYHAKCKVVMEVGISKDIFSEREIAPKKNDHIKILFAGRLEYWKGVHLAIRAYANILKQNSTVTFSIVGSGSEEQWFKDVARNSSVLDKIEWLPRVSQEELFQMYQEYDIFLFPSMHDSSGNVTVEALSFGLPIVCLDLGGPKEIVDKSCSRIITTNGKSEEQVVNSLAEVLIQLISKPEQIRAMRDNAQLKAQEYVWEKVVAKVYHNIDDRVLAYQPA